jgi:Sulfotransferase domain
LSILFHRVSELARGARSFLRPKRTALQNAKQNITQAGGPGHPSKEHQAAHAEHKRNLENLRREISLKGRELERMSVAYDAAKEWAKKIEYREGKKVAQQQLFELQSELRAEKQRARDRRRAFKQRKRIRSQLARQRAELRAVKQGAEAPTIEQVQEHKQEILRLKTDLRAARRRERVQTGPVTGALPDFLIIGAPKCGTTSLYYLLTRHPHVKPAAAKELHFFSSHFDLGIQWYRRCFPRPTLEDGRSTITGEATPSYLADLYAPARVYEVVPQARLIVLLRNPVDRAYSHYQMGRRKGWETTATFEEAVGAEKALRPPGEGETTSGPKNSIAIDEDSWYLTGGIYVDQLARWSSLFPAEQMLVLRSEDFSCRPEETLKRVLGFLELPSWEPEAGGLRRNLHTGGYEQEMRPDTRRRLEEYFEPHNRRLYTFLGEEFGW